MVDHQRARQILGVGREASPTEVDAAFRRLAARAHPDRGGDPDRFGEIVGARQRLTDRGDATRVRVPVQVVPDPGPLDRLIGVLRWRPRRGRTSRVR
ncbi:hypothetical protein BH23ACT2_BH23ACT2_16370 [soil metagenome]